MGKRYYCEYCDKSFADNPTGRKTHLTGVYHLRNKKAHYDSMRDSKEILADDASKRQCKSFFSSGKFLTENVFFLFEVEHTVAF